MAQDGQQLVAKELSLLKKRHRRCLERLEVALRSEAALREAAGLSEGSGGTTSNARVADLQEQLSKVSKQRDESRAEAFQLREELASRAKGGGGQGEGQGGASTFELEDLREKLEREHAERREERESLEADLRRERSSTANAASHQKRAEAAARAARAEAAGWHAKHNDMESELKRGREQLRVAELEIIALRDKNATQATALREARAQIGQQKTELAQLAAALDDLRQRLQEGLKEGSSAFGDYVRMKQENLQLKNDVERLHRAHETAKQQFRELGLGPNRKRLAAAGAVLAQPQGPGQGTGGAGAGAGGRRFPRPRVPGLGLGGASATGRLPPGGGIGGKVPLSARVGGSRRGAGGDDRDPLARSLPGPPGGNAGYGSGHARGHGHGHGLSLGQGDAYGMPPGSLSARGHRNPVPPGAAQGSGVVPPQAYWQPGAAADEQNQFRSAMGSQQQQQQGMPAGGYHANFGGYGARAGDPVTEGKRSRGTVGGGARGKKEKGRGRKGGRRGSGGVSSGAEAGGDTDTAFDRLFARSQVRAEKMRLEREKVAAERRRQEAVGQGYGARALEFHQARREVAQQIGEAGAAALMGGGGGRGSGDHVGGYDAGGEAGAGGQGPEGGNAGPGPGGYQQQGVQQQGQTYADGHGGGRPLPAHLQRAVDNMEVGRIYMDVTPKSSRHLLGRPKPDFSHLVGDKGGVSLDQVLHGRRSGRTSGSVSGGDGSGGEQRGVGSG